MTRPPASTAGRRSSCRRCWSTTPPVRSKPRSACMRRASGRTKDPAAPETLYVEAFAAPDTIDTMPDKTLLAFADHGKVGATMPIDGGDAEAVLDEFRQAGVDIAALAQRLQREGADAFAKSWRELLKRIDEKSAQLATAAAR